MTDKVRDHYEVLNVPLDADQATIKKAHRKLALKWHPDKNAGDETASETFRLIQQAYECLSDTSERKWYDEHREAILRGWSANGDSSDVEIIFDVVPYMYAGCYSGYEDDENGFFAVYQSVFSKIYEGEKEGWTSEGNIDDMPFLDIPPDFGSSESGWSQIGTFYTAWESFTSCLAFAWADKYDTKDADHRRMRRAMEDENRKARRTAKRKFNDDVAALVHFIKRRDPRVRLHRQKLEEARAAKLKVEKDEAQLKKKMKQKAKEEWREQAAERIAQAEEEDRAAGRIRLADLDDDYDYDYGKGKRGKKKNRGRQIVEDDIVKEDGKCGHDSEKVENEDENSLENCCGSEDDDEILKQLGLDNPAEFLDIESESYTEEDDEEEPDIWRCECCRKDFKSLGQMENHMKSKKHKEKLKKQQATMK
mmetsp:Transcript_29121/g.42966  ORF Transcript_29121/g.42966 Transcript_29121/m.42966 type:complete len:422 (+) Transcript_29121:91-1356(+)|eukprot:CAMPEP_0194237568 /NCGR_PEP_ID=MMETSP0158-20130606/4546_1 /TAXON_ID=33649 /ORGANISM="Thalassionema nitzschioides, Strain L26-B" /LENGTH=421 /DNA_ID=CAMNT_0038971635 /DNA_START=16 /DNA_END=1281 /DNA_ORIENTATION=-